MEKYESKHVRILRPAETVYGVLSRFDNLTPVLADPATARYVKP